MGTFDYTYSERQRDTNDELYKRFFLLDPVADVTFVIGAEVVGTPDTINVAVQVGDIRDTALEDTIILEVWLSDDADGNALTAGVPDGDVLIGTDGTILVEHTADAHFMIKTDDEGKFDLDVGHDADGSNWYLAVRLPNGRIVVSPILDFAA